MYIRLDGRLLRKGIIFTDEMTEDTCCSVGGTEVRSEDNEHD